MNITTQVSTNVTFEQYVTGQFECPWSDCLWCEGEIIEVPPETGLNNAIATYLLLEFSLYSRLNQLGLGIGHKDTDIEVDSPKHRTRKPDVMVMSRALKHRALKQQLQDQSSVIRQGMEPPLLIVEAISKNYRNVDLVDKVREYGDRRVPEYWTVDWDRADPHIIVRVWHQPTGQYVEHRYQPGDMVASTVLPGLSLAVDGILRGEQ